MTKAERQKIQALRRVVTFLDRVQCGPRRRGTKRAIRK